MKNERGFILLDAILLTLIVSIMAMILLNANSKVQQRNSTLYFTAINLANEQFALLESYEATGIMSNIPAADKESLNGVKENSAPIKFDVSYSVENSFGNLKEYKVTVKWNVDGEPRIFESTKTIRSIAEN